MSDATPENAARTTPSAAPETSSTGPIYRILTWMLVAALIGVYLLYNWYDGRLKSDLTDKDAEAAAMAERHSSLAASLRSATEIESGLRSEIAQLKRDAQTTAAERESLRTELQGRFDSLRTSLEGGEPELAAKVAKLEEEAKTAYAALEETLKDREGALKARLEESIRKAQALEHAQQTHEKELGEAREALLAQGQEHQQVEGKAAELQARLDQALAEMETNRAQGEQDLAAVKSELAAAADAASGERERLEREAQEIKAQAATAEEALTKEQAKVATLEESLTKEQSKIASLEESLTKERTQASQALANERRHSEAALKALKDADAKILAEVRVLYTQYAELAARQTDRGMLLKLPEKDLRFATGQAVLPKGPLPSLDRIAKLLQEHPKLNVHIEGHTDSAGPDDINLNLSKARAAAVMQALIERGVPQARLASDGVGKAHPIAENATAVGRGENRRVDVYVVEQPD